MYEFIKEDFLNMNPELIVQAPSRINLINPLDAVEADSWMPAVAIEGVRNPLSVFLYLKRVKKYPKIRLFGIEKKQGEDKYQLNVIKEEKLVMDIEKIKSKFNDNLKLIYASLYRIYLSNLSLWKEFLKSPVEIGLVSTIPRQSGLGGSSSIILALLYALAKYYNFFKKTEDMNQSDLPINRDTLAELCTKVEDKDLNITAGYSDRYVISKGGLSFCAYMGKINHKDITKEPLAVYDRIDNTYDIRSLPIIICFSGFYHDSGNLHQRLRKLYLDKNQDIIDKYDKLSEISWKARFALMKKDWRELGLYFKKNTQIMNKIMEIAGFEYGIGLVNNILIDLIEEHPQVYAAKLTGAGGGGSVFALVNPNYLDDIFKYWKDSLREIINNRNNFHKRFPNYPLRIIKELKNAEFFKVKINTSGVKKI